MLLFHQDAYLKEFDAQVIHCEKAETCWAVTLSNTAFYYTGGGQPYDTGTLGGARVLAVEKEGGQIRHYVDAPLQVGETVHGVIDWARRFDHMCQHAGDHLIAGTLYSLYGGMTIGLHIGETECSIDVDMGGKVLTRQEMDEVERIVLDRILQDAPIRAWFPTDEEMKVLPLRKDPTVSENIRVVLMGDFECVACGGTHPSSTGQIGLVKILRCQNNRGNMRVFFVAGQRALAHLQKAANCAEEASATFSTSVDSLPLTAKKAVERQKQLSHDLGVARTQLVLQSYDELLQTGCDGKIFAEFTGAPQDALLRLMDKLTKNSGIFALLASKIEGRTLCVLGRSDDLNANAGTSLRALLTPLGGKGGGKPDCAMGSLPESADLAALREAFLALE